ncbi:MAG: DUF2162 domain-containing protein [Synergistaceae bacterium]|jgi:predicted transporter|nr:DUF2162 domain-containing protein [Synergistaceae bacterium]
MELKFLWLGMVVSIAAFSVKTGIGWAYLWRSGSACFRAGTSLVLLSAYAAVFGGVFLLVSQVNLLERIDVVLPLLRGGVTVHWLAALLLFAWGLFLLKRPDDCRHARRSLLALVTPCPVCLSAILMSTGCLALYFPDEMALSIAGLFTAFVVIAAVSAAAILLGSEKSGAPESGLGVGMMLMGAYFIISALVVPQFADIDRVYRLATRAQGEQLAGGRYWPLFAIFALVSVGFLKTWRELAKRNEVSGS